MRHETLELVLQSISPEQRSSLIDSLGPVAEQGVDVFASLAIAEWQGRVVAASWLQPQVGRTATLWPPVLAYDDHSEWNRPLAGQALASAQPPTTVLVQTLLHSPSDPFADDLIALGFRQLADLKYLILTVPTRATRCDSELQFCPATADDFQLLKQLIIDSYIGTLDCPGLEGLRDIDDVLAGYRTIGTHDPALWQIARWRDEPAGALLLAPYPAANQWELVYMGVVPGLRGRSFGRQMLEEVRYRAAEAKVGHVVLAVDADNYPAVDMYKASGFVAWAQCTAYIKYIEANRVD